MVLSLPSYCPDFNTSNVEVPRHNSVCIAFAALISIHQMWRFRLVIERRPDNISPFQYIKCGGSALLDQCV